MLNFIKKNIPDFKGSPRSVSAKKNIFLLFVFNGFNFIFNILLVRFTLDYLGKESYGIWITLVSVLTWFSYLDFGLGNGLRNKLAEAFAKNEYKLARIFVSTTYAVFAAALIILYFIFLLVYQNIEWTSVFNTSPLLQDELNKLVFFVFTFFTINFVLKLVGFIVTADQKPAINGLFSFLVNLITVLVVFILVKTASSSLLLLGTLSTAVPVLVFFIASIILFKTRYKEISPSLKFVNLKYSKDLIGLGFQFFVIQAASLIVFATDNMIITQIFGPNEVTPYNIAYRYFNYIPIVFLIILNPLWSAYTEAYVKEDTQWIKSTVKQIMKVWFILSVIVLVMIAAADFVYDIWLASQVKIPFVLTILMGVFAIVTNWNNIFAYFINGVGKIRLSLYYSVVIGIINIPLSILLAKHFEMGIPGVITATIICLLGGSIYAPIQYYKIINKKDSGIWGK